MKKFTRRDFIKQSSAALSITAGLSVEKAFADFVVQGVTCGGSKLGYTPRIMFIGDSITKGSSDSFTYNSTLYEDVGGMRTSLQLLTNKLKYVGQWGGRPGYNTTETPSLETKDNDDNYLLLGDFQPKHFGFSGAETAEMVDAFSDLNQTNQFLPLGSKDIVVIHLGTNDTGTEPYLDTSNIPSVALKILSLVETINSFNPDITIIVCQIAPMVLLPTDSLYDPPFNGQYWDPWAVAFNSVLKIVIDQAVIDLGKDNLFTSNMHTPMKDGWTDGTFSNVGDIHPNHSGFGVMADILYDDIIKGIL